MALVRAHHVLFLCNTNAARSIMAEYALRRFGAGRFRAFSAGSQPLGEVLPETVEVLTRLGYDVTGLRCKSWTEFSGEGAPALDFVFTVSDDALSEGCPEWPGRPVSAHWGVRDPVACDGPPDQRRKAFNRAYLELEARVKVFVNIPVEALNRLSLQVRLDDLGRFGLPRAQ